MSDSEEEKGSPYEGWVGCAQPWEYLEQQRKHTMFKAGDCTLFTDVVTHERDRIELTTFEPRTMKRMLADFFSDKGIPKFFRTARYADRWIVWAVTEGRFRSNREKQVFVYQGRDADIIQLKHYSQNMWTKVPECEGFQIIAAITDRCNMLYDEILRAMGRHGCRSKGLKNNLENFMYMGEFVQFQTHRGPKHKMRRWSYQPMGRGGNQKDIPRAKSIPHPQHSVHRLLMQYHEWLPTTRKVRATK